MAEQNTTALMEKGRHFDCPHCGEKDIEVNFSEVEYNTDYWGDGAVVTCPHCGKEIELGDYEYD